MSIRLASRGMQIVLWTTLGVVFGLLAERRVSTLKSREPAPSSH